MQELTPDIQKQLLVRAQKNAKWAKKLDVALSTMDPADTKREKVEQLQQVLKIQALLIVKKLKELTDEGENDDASEPESNSNSNIKPPMRNPTLNMKGFNGGSGLPPGAV